MTAVLEPAVGQDDSLRSLARTAKVRRYTRMAGGRGQVRKRGLHASDVVQRYKGAGALPGSRSQGSEAARYGATLGAVDARAAPFLVFSLMYVWPLVAEVISGVRKTRAGEPARWEGMLNVLLLPVVVIAAAIARPVIAWIPPWWVVLLLGLLVDALGFAVWWAGCLLAGRSTPVEPGSV